MQLTDLVGAHKLSGVDRIEEKPQDDWSYSIADVLRFELDGVTYGAVEDPSDGYRSSMAELRVYEGRPAHTFDPVDCQVVCRSEQRYESCDLIEVIANGHVVLSVGNGNTNDYYPYFVARWDPTPLGMVDTTGE